MVAPSRKPLDTQRPFLLSWGYRHAVPPRRAPLNPLGVVLERPCTEGVHVSRSTADLIYIGCHSLGRDPDRTRPLKRVPVDPPFLPYISLFGGAPVPADLRDWCRSKGFFRLKEAGVHVAPPSARSRGNTP